MNEMFEIEKRFQVMVGYRHQSPFHSFCFTEKESDLSVIENEIVYFSKSKNYSPAETIDGFPPEDLKNLVIPEVYYPSILRGHAFGAPFKKWVRSKWVFYPFGGNIVDLKSLVLCTEEKFLDLIEDPRWFKIKYFSGDHLLFLWDKENNISEFRSIESDNFGFYCNLRLKILENWNKKELLHGFLSSLPKRKREEAQVFLDYLEET